MHLIPIPDFFHKNVHVIKKNGICTRKVHKLQRFSKVFPNVGGNTFTPYTSIIAPYTIQTLTFHTSTLHTPHLHTIHLHTPHFDSSNLHTHMSKLFSSTRHTSTLHTQIFYTQHLHNPPLHTLHLYTAIKGTHTN